LSVAGTLAAQSLVVKQAVSDRSGAATLQLVMAVELGPLATEALQAGLMLAFDVDWQLHDGRELRQSLALRYSPLLRSYQLAVGKTPPQTFTLRNALLAAMENAQLRWPDQAACAGACGGRVRVRLDPAQLPAPLRLPALFDSDWDFDSGWKQIDSGAGGRGQGEQTAAPSDPFAGLKEIDDGARGRCQEPQPAAALNRAAFPVPCPLPPAPFFSATLDSVHPQGVGAP
jgi:hypothetical protein